MKTLGNLLLSKRKEKRLTQKNIGQEIGISTPVVYLWEKDKREPRASQLAVLMEVLSIGKKEFIASVKATKEAKKKIKEGTKAKENR